jgi:hypothetical protein
MAAGGFKEFVAGEVLDEDEINDYLMQGVLVFAGTAARGSAITSPVEGQFSFLKDTDTVEFYDGSAWVDFASGGILVDYLVIAGGASGGAHFYAGGGGAGGYSESSDVKLSFTAGSAQTVPLTVGAGGAAIGIVASPGNNGSNSRLAQVISFGGGGGASFDSINLIPARSGASGGGGASGNTAQAGASGTLGQGFAGGSSSSGASLGAAGGGGGAAIAGADASGSTAGAGGSGIASTITGSSVIRAGGGGGSSYQGTIGAGGAGGGGAGARNQPTTTQAVGGTANTGGGGGGASHSSNTPTSGAGGSGVVILSIPSAVTVTFSGGVTQTNAVVGENKVYTVTAAGPTDTVTIG